MLLGSGYAWQGFQNLQGGGRAYPTQYESVGLSAPGSKAQLQVQSNPYKAPEVRVEEAKSSPQIRVERIEVRHQQRTHHEEGVRRTYEEEEDIEELGHTKYDEVPI